MHTAAQTPGGSASATTAPATVTDGAGTSFDALVSNLLPNSLVLKRLPQNLRFRDTVVVEILGHTVRGEVVFADNHEAAVVFDTRPEIFEAIEAFEDYVHASVADDPDASDNTGPGATIDLTLGIGSWDAMPEVDDHGRLKSNGPLDALGMLVSLKAGRPLLVRSSVELSRVMVDGEPGFEVVAIPAGGPCYILHPPEESAGLDAALASVRSALDDALPSADEAAETADLPDPEDLPVLQPNGEVVFRSYDQLVAQHQVNLSNGAVMVRGAAQPMGAVRSLRLVIPDVEPVEIARAEVVFTADGKVGFSVSDIDSLRRTLALRLSLGGDEASGPSRPAASAPRAVRPTFSYETRLTGLPDSRTIIGLRAGAIEDLEGARGWYIGLMDRILRSGRDAMLKLDNDGERLKVWIHDHRVVAAERFPPPEKDRLGERLVSSRAIDGPTLDKMLEDARRTRKPVGQIILLSGVVTRAAVHKALRRQITDRVMTPCDWEAGTVAIGGWTDPPVDADLLPVSGDAVVTSLLRRQLQLTRLATLREELTDFLNRKTTVDLSRIAESYRLTDREQRYYQRAADARGTLANLISLVKARPLEGYRLVLLGAALGFISFASPLRGR